MTNIPDYFYDKKLCDAIRDIVKYSATSIEDAERYMRISTDYERDSFIVKKLANVGMSKYNIIPVIEALNTN